MVPEKKNLICESRRRFCLICSKISFAAFPVLSGYLNIVYAGDNCADNAKNKHKSEVPAEPVYLELHRKGILKQRGEKLWQMMKSCSLCPRECGAARLDGEKGFARQMTS